MLGAGTLHFELYGTVGGVDIVELLLPAQTVVIVEFLVEGFGEMADAALAGEIESEGVEGGETIAGGHLREEMVEKGRGEHPQRTEVEIVTQRTVGPVDDGVYALGIPTVGIDHGGLFVIGDLGHALEATIAHLELMGAEEAGGQRGLKEGTELTEEGGTGQAVGFHSEEARRGFCTLGGFRSYEDDASDEGIGEEGLKEGFAGGCGGVGQYEIYSWIH